MFVLLFIVMMIMASSGKGPNSKNVSQSVDAFESIASASGRLNNLYRDQALADLSSELKQAQVTNDIVSENNDASLERLIHQNAVISQENRNDLLDIDSRIGRIRGLGELETSAIRSEYEGKALRYELQAQTVDAALEGINKIAGSFERVINKNRNLIMPTRKPLRRVTGSNRSLETSVFWKNRTPEFRRENAQAQRGV